MSGPGFLDKLKAKFGDKISGSNLEAIDPWIEVTPDGLVEVCQHLKTNPEFQFNLLNCITVVDYLHTDEKKAKKVDWDPHLEIVYHLSSTHSKHTLVCLVKHTEPTLACLVRHTRHARQSLVCLVRHTKHTSHACVPW